MPHKDLSSRRASSSQLHNDDSSTVSDTVKTPKPLSYAGNHYGQLRKAGVGPWRMTPQYLTMKSLVVL